MLENIVVQKYQGAEFLVDVPVSINIWIRPECQQKQYEVVRKAKPSTIFLISDGGRNEEEWQAISKNRNLYDTGIDWTCTVYKLYETENQGMYAEGRRSRELIWSKVDRCIFLEDDVLPSVSFFRYCAELLERYKDDLRVSVICGMNHLGVYDATTADYFFSRQGSIWGYASWKRTYQAYGDISYKDDPYAMRLLKQRLRHNPSFWKKVQGYAKDPKYGGHTPGSEFLFEMSMYAQNQLQIIPRKNMVCNIGATKNSAHSDSLHLLPKGIRQVFEMKTYEVPFPLHHPNYVIHDVEYEKKRNYIMAYNNPWVSKKYWIEQTLLLMRHGYWKKAVLRIANRIHKKVKTEK